MVAAPSLRAFFARAAPQPAPRRSWLDPRQFDKYSPRVVAQPLLSEPLPNAMLLAYPDAALGALLDSKEIM
jgi:hypothetical protein